LGNLKHWLKKHLSHAIGFALLAETIYLQNRVLTSRILFLQKLTSLTATEKNQAVDRVKEFLALITPREIDPPTLQRFGPSGDSGYVLLGDLESVSSVLSLGVGDNNDIDFFFADTLGKNVFAYDHTVEQLPKKHPLIHFRKIGVGNGEGMLPMRAILEREDLGDSALLLCDIEGAEFQPGFSEGTAFSQFKQISIELHNLSDLITCGELSRVLETLRAISASHRPVHIHLNNFDPLNEFAGLPLPETLEVTFARETDYSFGNAITKFPRKLDSPNTRWLPDPAWTIPLSAIS
jgi:hypothetical protein